MVECRSCSPNRDATLGSLCATGGRGLSDTVVNFQGLTVEQNHVFVLKNSGFVTYGVTGSYDVLAIVD
ncbi:hypothetical protein EDB83DRAFT_2518223 [Lactarius deliciosus]|nr:hypothetical protein EDB83DRAFT_2518223 [Lactarius deliciosus]